MRRREIAAVNLGMARCAIRIETSTELWNGVDVQPRTTTVVAVTMSM